MLWSRQRANHASEPVIASQCTWKPDITGPTQRARSGQARLRSQPGILPGGGSGDSQAPSHTNSPLFLLETATGVAWKLILRILPDWPVSSPSGPEQGSQVQAGQLTPSSSSWMPPAPALVPPPFPLMSPPPCSWLPLLQSPAVVLLSYPQSSSAS